MAHQTFALNLARSMIADQGVAIIWRLHIEATVLWRMGNRAAAEAFVEIAHGFGAMKTSRTRRSGPLFSTPWRWPEGAMAIAPAPSSLSSSPMRNRPLPSST